MRAIPDRGDVILLSFDPTLGHEQAGFRPAVVLSPEYYKRPPVSVLSAPSLRV
jgi:mRNA interferase MazF